MENIKVNYINNPFELPANKNRRSFSVTPDLIDTYIEIIEKCDNSKKTYSYIENENILNVDSDRTITISQDDINSYVQKQDLITLLTNVKDVKNDNNNENVVSIYTIYKIIENLSKNIELKKNDFENQLKERLNFSKTIYIKYENEKIRISYESGFSTKLYFFSENFGDVFVDSEDYGRDYRSYTTSACEILSSSYDILEQLFKFYKEIDIYMTEEKVLKSIDDKFNVLVSFNSLVVSKSTYQCRQKNTFEIKTNNIQRTITNLSNSSKILTLTKGNEVNILKNVYVNINECPTWLQNGLIQARDKELYKKFEVNSTEDLSMEKKGIFKKVKKLLKGEENE